VREDLYQGGAACDGWGGEARARGMRVSTAYMAGRMTPPSTTEARAERKHAASLPGSIGLPSPTKEARPTRSERATPVTKPHRLENHQTSAGKGPGQPPRRVSRHRTRTASDIALSDCLVFVSQAAAAEGRAV
jgi:hypothetical protein